MPELDLRTLVIVTAVVSIGALVALFALWRSQTQRNGAGFWVAGLTFTAAGIAMIGLRDLVPEFSSIVMGNLAVAIGLLLFLRGCRIFAGRPPLQALDWASPPVVAVLLAYFTYVDNDLFARVILMSTVVSVISLAIAVTVLREKNAPWRSTGFGVAAIFGVLGIVMAARIPFAGQIAATAKLLEQSDTQSWVFLALIFIIVGSVLTLFLMTYAALEGDQRILRQAVTQTSSSVIITDRDGVIEYVNQAFTERTGFTLREVIGRNPRFLKSGETSAEQYQTLWETITAGKVWRGEFHNRVKDGELFWEFASISPVKQKDGRISHFVAVKEDITKRKEAEDALQQKTEELEVTVVELQASKDGLETQASELATLAENLAALNERLEYEAGVKNKFFSIIAHDLKSPFNSLVGMTEMMSQMADRFSKDKLVEYAKDVNDAAERVFDLLQNLLEWSRLQMEGAKFEPSLISIRDLAQGSVGVLATISQEKSISLKNNIDETLAFADRDMIQMVILNLVNNALKFTPHGGSIELSTRMNEGMVQVTVTDTGVGMSKEQVEKVFALDQKTSTTGTDGEKGTGLGLPLCKEMVEKNGGTIWIESAPGEGARFHFTLPAKSGQGRLSVDH